MKLTKATALANELVRDLEEKVLSGALPPGSRFPTEKWVMDHFAVSRTVVREAFARLVAKGLLVSRRGSGAYVADDARYQGFQISRDELRAVDDLHRLFEMRMPLEAEMAALACERCDASDLATMAAAVDALANAATAEEAIAADTAFHAAMARATRNEYFSRFTEFLGVRLVPPRRMYLTDRDGPISAFVAEIAADHRAILDGITAGDRIRAADAARSHMQRSCERHERIRDHLGEPDPAVELPRVKAVRPVSRPARR
jgi:GntR family transcriptional repressor for pyruvate dehydrogenase complex